MNDKTMELLKGQLLATRALKDSMEQSLASTPDSDPWRYVSYKTYMAKYQYIVQQVSSLVKITVPINTWDLDKIRGPSSTTGQFQRELFEAVFTDLNLLIAYIEHSVGLKADEIRGIRDFFEANLRRAVFREPSKEAEIQDVIEQLLIGKGFLKGVDYGREVGRVGVSIKEVVPDFIVPRLSMAIEVKLSKDRAKSKLIVDEINADIQAYGKKYSAILFIVYDIGSIQDESAFRYGLETGDGYVQVIVVKH